MAHWAGWNGDLWNAVAFQVRERGIRNAEDVYRVTEAVKERVGYWDIQGILRYGPDYEPHLARVNAEIDRVLRQREFRAIARGLRFTK